MFIDEHAGSRPLAARMGIADGGHVHAHKLELGAHVGAEELSCVIRVVAEHMFCRHPGHLVAGRDQTENLLVPQCTFTDGVDVRVAGAAVVVDHDAAAFANLQHALTGQRILRTDAGGEQHDVGFQRLTIGKTHAMAAAFARLDTLGVLAGVHGHTQLFDLAPQHGAAAIIHLYRHQARCELHHMGGQTHVTQSFGGFKPEQTATNHGADLGAGARGTDRFQVLDGAINKAVVAVVALNRRHERIGPGGQDQRVVVVNLAAAGGDAAGLAVDREHTFAKMQGDVVVGEEIV